LYRASGEVPVKLPLLAIVEVSLAGQLDESETFNVEVSKRLQSSLDLSLERGPVSEPPQEPSIPTGHIARQLDAKVNIGGEVGHAES
jgi:hypothetical protein